MNHIPTFSEFNASLNESIETFNINSIEDLSTIDDIIKVARSYESIGSCNVEEECQRRILTLDIHQVVHLFI